MSCLAVWYESIGRFDDARNTYRRFADKTDGLNRVARAHLRQRQYRQAADVYRELIGRDPDNKIQWKGALLGVSMEAGKYDDAITLANELIEEDAPHADKWQWRLGIAYRDSHRYREAIAQFRQCESFPHNYFEMAVCHRAMKQYNEAITLYRQIVVAEPKSAAAATYHMGMTYEQAGQTEQAIKTLQQVCRQYPRESYASQAHARLQSQYKISVTLGGDIEK